MRCLFAVLGVLGLLISCAGTSGVVDKIDSAGDTPGVKDLIAEVSADIVLDHDEAGPDLPWLTELPDVTLSEVVGPECSPGEGCFLDPCLENADCLSGWCVEHLGDAVCTQSCQEECPPGWTCKQTGGGGPDVAFICVSDVANLCKPCATGADCKSVGGKDDLCLSYDDEGSFCGSGCAVGTDCPWGFSCLTTVTVDGISTLQCVADAGVCPCTAKSVGLALWTPCAVESEAGQCTGKRLCTLDGLSTCDAAIPVAETCNGIDDDCDSAVDEPDDVAGDSVPLCDDGNECTADQCGGEVGCSHQELNEGECKDGDVCTVGDHCDDGLCVGQPVNCDDGDPCTDDSCDGLGGCLAEPNQATCDDGDPCTVADRCEDLECKGTSVPCDCQADADCEDLEDVDFCNGTLVCDMANWPYKCVVDKATVVFCPDAEAGPDAACLQPQCDAATGQCSLEPSNDGFACDDGDSCFIGEHCQAGTCGQGVSPVCKDDNPCTDDSCDPDVGCVFTANAAVCSDGDVCTTDDQCAAGTCAGGPALVCEDGNVCNGDESCDPAVGCKPGVPLSCSDEDVCNGLEACEPATGCTGGVPLQCDDGNQCDGTENCDPAAGCQPGPPLSCIDDDVCNGLEGCDPATGCTAGEPLLCDDANPCTADSCDAQAGCVHSFLDAGCDDGNECTVGDHCDAGDCLYSGLLSCADDNVCTTESCDPAAGCIYLMNNAPCDDGNVCSLGDHCNLGSCISTGDLLCDDGNPCSDDSCAPLNGCQFLANSEPCDDSNACTSDDKCEAKACKGQVVVPCDDDNQCTIDACDAQTGCFHTPVPGGCDDGSLCTTSDTCVEGICVPGDPLPCNDSNICTDDTCDAMQGCLFVPNQAACDDQDDCTSSSVCSGGGCVGSGPVECDIAAWCADNGGLPNCFTSACVAEGGCTYTAVPDCCGNAITDGAEDCDDGNDVDGDGCTALCASEGAPGPYYKLTDTPNPATVFNSIVVTFKYPNNLTNGIWHRTSNTILVGEFNQQKHWWHSATQGGYPSNPNYGSGRYGRMVHMPGTRLVAYTTSPSSDGMGPASTSQLKLASIDPDSGALGGPITAQFTDGYNGTCNILSSSVTELMVYNGSNQVRRYETSEGSGVLTLNETVTLGSSIPSNGTCNGGGCYGGTFAWDGKYFYFTKAQKGSGNLSYKVYLGNGTHVGDYNASGGGTINGTYFDWNVGRYAIHDGYGNRQGGSVYSSSGGNSDTQCYGPVSSYHTLVP